MTDEDELRDRIAATLDRNFNPDQYPIMAAIFRDYAQAIIDEFGLTLEERSVAPGYDGRPVYYNTEKGRLDQDVMGAYIAELPVEFRVVGNWEEG